MLTWCGIPVGGGGTEVVGRGIVGASSAGARAGTGNEGGGGTADDGRANAFNDGGGALLPPRGDGGGGGAEIRGDGAGGGALNGDAIPRSVDFPTAPAPTGGARGVPAAGRGAR